jgi:hypothetical protein
VPLIWDVVHDISPVLENQVVRELKCWISAVEFMKIHPRRVNWAGPLDQKFVTAARQPALNDFDGLQASTPMSDWGQHPWTGRRLAVELLEQPYMECIMQLGN